jgi:hypothetical protein
MARAELPLCGSGLSRTPTHLLHSGGLGRRWCGDRGAPFDRGTKWHWSFAIPLVWIFNLWGTIDLLYAFYDGIVLEIEPGLFGAAFYIPTMIVPPLLLIHALIFLILLRTEKTPAG